MEREKKSSFEYEKKSLRNSQNNDDDGDNKIFFWQNKKPFRFSLFHFLSLLPIIPNIYYSHFIFIFIFFFWKKCLRYIYRFRFLTCFLKWWRWFKSQIKSNEKKWMKECSMNQTQHLPTTNALLFRFFSHFLSLSLWLSAINFLSFFIRHHHHHHHFFVPFQIGK